MHPTAHASRAACQMLSLALSGSPCKVVAVGCGVADTVLGRLSVSGKVAASVSSDVVRERVCSACVACVLDLAARLSLPLQCDPGPATNPRNRGSHLTNSTPLAVNRGSYSARARPAADPAHEVPRTPYIGMYSAPDAIFYHTHHFGSHDGGDFCSRVVLRPRRPGARRKLAWA